MLPAYLPNPVAALLGGGIPVDFNRNWSDSRRVFGDGKTFRGFFLGILAGIGIGLLQIQIAGTFNLTWLPQHTPASVTLLAIGALAGDLCKSFFKRRFGMERGEKWLVADQYDLVAGSLLFVLVFDAGWALSNITIPALIIIIIITPILHRGINIIGYLFRIKEVPW
jgi:CDP-2,3-bis-(O-geranylgeranyl)-sn-glycerol synthase